MLFILDDIISQVCAALQQCCHFFREKKTGPWTSFIMQVMWHYQQQLCDVFKKVSMQLSVTPCLKARKTFGLFFSP